MVTIVTDVRLKEGSEQEWDATMQERMTAARKQAGWVGGQMLSPVDDPTKRVIVGTWQTRDDWQKWHEDPDFADTRAALAGLVAEPERYAWHEVRLDMRPTAGRRASSRHERRPMSDRKVG
jgi:heme-degrading monooxygenase HmoA